jgi:hypothetical protein
MVPLRLRDLRNAEKEPGRVLWAMRTIRARSRFRFKAQAAHCCGPNAKGGACLRAPRWFKFPNDRRVSIWHWGARTRPYQQPCCAHPDPQGHGQHAGGLGGAGEACSVRWAPRCRDTVLPERLAAAPAVHWAPRGGWRSAVSHTIILSCRRRGINPQEYLTGHGGSSNTAVPARRDRFSTLYCRPIIEPRSMWRA